MKLTSPIANKQPPPTPVTMKLTTPTLAPAPFTPSSPKSFPIEQTYARKAMKCRSVSDMFRLVWELLFEAVPPPDCRVGSSPTRKISVITDFCCFCKFFWCSCCCCCCSSSSSSSS